MLSLTSRRFTTGDLAKLSGVPVNTVERWCELGYVPCPFNERREFGEHRVYTIMQALAVVTAARYRRAGATAVRVSGVCHFLSGLTLERLEHEFSEGRTFPVPSDLLHRAAEEEGLEDGFWMPGMMVASPADDPTLSEAARALIRRLDLPTIWGEVKDMVANLNRWPGRKRRKRLGFAVNRGQ